MRAVWEKLRLYGNDSYQSGFQWLCVKKVKRNKAFARPGHMVQNRPYWAAMYAVGHRGQSNSHQIFLCLHFPLRSLCPSMLDLYHVNSRANEPLQ